MSAEHHLAGPCEGIVIYRDGTVITVKDARGREDFILACVSETSARAAEWQIRDALYARYDTASQGQQFGGNLHG
ncbi:hypothetical protein E5S70_17505 [Ensifer adhaerens]|uniref:hypothetical protein n=1 Tax=Ensifer canadensis TaxID=555315 RepID=UPI00148FE673|nr:hypothetical protein [Ensifer canadensis]NOV17850.1 hypothetical protein [Ensifer canadensis]